MATLVLSAVGQAVGGPLGAAFGSIMGSALDQALFGPKVSGSAPQLTDLQVQSSSYGQPIPRIWGAENRAAGNLIWSTDIFGGPKPAGGKGSGRRDTDEAYYVHCAFALCRGPAARLGRIWADGKLLRDIDGVQTVADDIRFHTGAEDQMPDALIEATEGMGAAPAYRGLAYVVLEKLGLADFGNRIPNLTFEIIAHESVTVANVIEELCTAANVPFLDAARADFFDLRGYALSRPATIRAALDPLRSAFAFDGAEIDGAMCFFGLEGQPVARPSRGELAAHPHGSQRPDEAEWQRESDVELPRQLTVQHLDPARDYQPNSQRARRATANSDADLSVDLPIVMDASEAKSHAERMLSLAWGRRNSVTHRLPIRYLHVEPGHKIVVPGIAGDAILRVKRREVSLPSIVVLHCETDGSPALSRQAVADPAPVPPQEVRIPGPTTAHLLDLPMLADADDLPGFYVAANGPSDGWHGALLFRSVDAGATFAQLAALPRRVTMGVAQTILPPASEFVWDRAGSIDVQLLRENEWLEGVSDELVLAGANMALVGSEIIQFGEAELLAPGLYRLTRLLRGRRGTEAAISSHAAGERFVLLSDPDLVRCQVEAGELGTRPYRAPSIGTLVNDAPVFDFAHGGRSQRPWAPVHPRGSRDAGGDLAISWIRRTRMQAPWMDGVDAPLGELNEAYEIDVMDGATVKRTIAVTGPAATYSATDQAVDFGTIPATVAVRIFQMSARVGRGEALEASL